MSTIRVIIHSDFLPKREIIVNRTETYINFSKEILSGVKKHDNKLNQFISRTFCCLFKIDTRKTDLIMIFEDFYSNNRKITSTIQDLAKNGILNCYIKEASENEIAEYNARISEELYGNTRFIDVPLDYSDDDKDGAVDRVIDERSRLYEYASNFKASNRTLRSARFFKWSTEKKKVKGHYYSWD